MGEEKIITGYKGFDEKLCCRGKQYAVHTTFTESEAILCKSGMHFCQEPLDVLRYYPYYKDGSFSRYARVTAPADKVKNDVNKCATTEMTVESEMSFDELVAIACAETINKAIRKGDYSASTNTGRYSASTNTGDCSASTNTGRCSASTNTGDYSVSTNTGCCSVSTNTGCCSVSTNTGCCSVSVVVGLKSKATVKNNSLAIAAGPGTSASGNAGSYLVLTEFIENTVTGEFQLHDCKTFFVDGEKVKADTYYRLKSGCLVEVEPNEESDT